MAGTKRRSTRQAATRKRSVYVEPDTEDDFTAESDGEVDFHPETPASPPPPKKRKTIKGRTPQTRSRAKSKQVGRPIKSLFRVGKPLKPNSKTLEEEKTEFSGPSDRKIPMWTSLPVDIWRDIFNYASHPVDQNDAENGNSVSWLLRAARSCRAFALPALEAFYRSPFLGTTLHPHEFLDLLGAPKDRRYIDYNVKVHEINIDVRRLAYVAHNRPSFDLCALVAELPQLQHMQILHPRYVPPYRPAYKIQRWTFAPEGLFDAMDKHNIRLKSWRWSRDMIPKNAFFDLYGEMTAAHRRRAFSRLERLVVCGFNYEDSSEPSEVHTTGIVHGSSAVAPGLATSIGELSALQDLTFVSCDVIMEKFLQRLPVNLQRLELSNCLEITSDMLRAFFSTSASCLRELVLNHNAALNLSFLTGLKASCPRLEVLKVDMQYYSEKYTINDAEAFYDELLSQDEVPIWPSTLRHLELVRTQKWHPQAAQNLFRSLLDSAADLPELRTLIIQAHINIPWRDRVGFRDQWIQRLRRVYLRQEKQPARYLGSLCQYRLWKQAQTGTSSTAGLDGLGKGRTDDDLPLARRFSHVRVSPHKRSGDTEIFTDSDDPAPAQRQPRRSRRVAETHIAAASTSATPTADSESEEESQEQDWRQRPEEFIQGMCGVVDVRIDNQRPTENQFTEGDFLDSEASGDEDWHEGGDSGAEESYAW